jgi:hypothetical protein
LPFEALTPKPHFSGPDLYSVLISLRTEIDWPWQGW